MPEGREEIRREVLRRLDEIQDPCSVAGGTPMGLNEMGLVKSVGVSDGGDVEIDLRLTSPCCHMIGFMKKTAIEKVSGIDGVHAGDHDPPRRRLSSASSRFAAVAPAAIGRPRSRRSSGARSAPCRGPGWSISGLAEQAVVADLFSGYPDRATKTLVRISGR